MTRTLDQEQFTSAGHILGGWLWQYNRFIAGVEGDYYFGGQTSKDPRYLVPALCDAGVISTGNFGCGSGAAFGGSFQTRGHVRGIAGWEFTPRFMGFLAGGLAIGELGAGGIQVGGIIVDNPAPIVGWFGQLDLCREDVVRLVVGRRRAGQAQQIAGRTPRISARRI